MEDWFEIDETISIASSYELKHNRVQNFKKIS